MAKKSISKKKAAAGGKKGAPSRYVFNGIPDNHLVSAFGKLPRDVGYYGSGALVAGVLVVADTRIAAGSLVFAQRQAVAGTSGVGLAITRTAGTNFTITSQTAGALTTQTGDTSTVAYLVIY